MATIKRTYLLPDGTIERFEKKVPVRQRSATVAGLIEDWLTQSERAAIREKVMEGCKEMSDLYTEIARDWASLDEEIDRMCT